MLCVKPTVVGATKAVERATVDHIRSPGEACCSNDLKMRHERT
jgi:hypothetical protein